MTNRSPEHRLPVSDVRQAADLVLAKLPEFWRRFRTPLLPRVCEEISWIAARGETVVDLGGGAGFHASICACLGMEAYCVDSFMLRHKGHAGDHFNEHNASAEKAASELGVRFIHTDLLDWTPAFEKDAIDVVMSLDNLEHLHHSPKGLYSQMVDCLAPGGLFLLGTPNAANLAKRVRVPLGKNIFASMDAWYCKELFIGHVREPVLADLTFIARDLGLHVQAVFGRNWIGLEKVPSSLSAPAKAADRLLRVFPSLCSDIYILAAKPI